MILESYVIKDKKIEGFGTPVFYPNKAVAVRDFQTAIKNGTIKFGEDMELYFVAKYDTESGRFFEANSPIYIDTNAEEVQL